MRINDIIHEQVDSFSQTLKKKCSDFLTESGGLPLFKELNEKYPDFHRVKVRHQKKKDEFSTSLNLAFESERTQFSQRAIFATSYLDNITESSFYIFPTNKYKFLYNPSLDAEDPNNLQAFDSIYEQFGHKKGRDLLAEVLKFSFTPQNLEEGLSKKSNIIIYGIPSYYALRVSAHPEYNDVLTSLA